MTDTGVQLAPLHPRQAAFPTAWVWIGVAGASGVAAGTGFAPTGWWAATVLGVSGLAVAARRTHKLPRTVVAGLAFGIGFTAPTLSWMSAINLGAAIGLILVMSGWYAALGALLHLARRNLLLPLIPQLQYVGRQSVAGTGPGLLDIRLADGTPATLGVLACFDVAFDPVVHDLADAQLLVVQSSNAMYQGTAQVEQQFAITRARAAELRREILVVTTSGITGLIDPYGRVTMRDTGPGAAHGVEQIPLRASTTPASRHTVALEQTLAGATVLWILGLAAGATHRSPGPILNRSRGGRPR